MTEAYIGDGVYSRFDGFQIWLRTERDGRTHEIALEPEAYLELTRYADRIWKPAATKGDT